jgi:hypothetical protein
MALNIIHSAVAHGGYELASGSLRSLHELALTADQHNAYISWAEIRNDFRRNGKARILDAWIYLSYRMFGSSKLKGIGDTPSALGYFARYRLQARSRWADELAKRLCLFSARNIRERYGCDDRLLTLNAGRLLLMREISSDYARRIARSSWRFLFGTCA